MNLLPFTLLVREALLQHSLPPALLAPADSLRQRLYRAAVKLVPPSSSAHRGTGDLLRRSDEALLGGFLQGDANAFEVLMDRHLPWMQAWAQKHLPAAEAQDAAQEAFIDLLKKAPSFQSHSSLRGYLFGFLRISVLRALRSLSRRGGESLDDEPLDTLADTSADPETMLLTRRFHSELAEALSRVCNLREQEVILFTLEGQDDTTIASALEIKIGNVRVLRHRALAKLREALATSSV